MILIYFKHPFISNMGIQIEFILDLWFGYIFNYLNLNYVLW